MNDHHDWRAPGSPEPMDGRSEPMDGGAGPAGARSGAPAPPPPTGPPIGAATTSRAWAPPPREGIVPLRPMTVGTVLSGSFRMIRRDPRTTLAPALVVSAITTALAGVGQWLVNTWAVEEMSTASYTDEMVSTFLAIGLLGILAGIIPIAISIAANAILQGMIVVSVSRAVLGERIALSGVLGRVRGRIGALVGWAGIAFLAGILAMALLVLVVVGFAMLGDSGIVVGVVLAVLLALGMLVPAFWLVIKLGFVSPALVLERFSLRAAIRRSWSLTRGRYWRLLGITLLVAVIVAVATAVVLTPVSLAIFFVFSLTLPTGGGLEAFETMTLVTLIANGIVSAIAGAFGLVLQTSTNALLYLDTRMRAEGLDLTMSRYVEDRQHGVPVADPFPGHAPASAGAPGTAWTG